MLENIFDVCKYCEILYNTCYTITWLFIGFHHITTMFLVFSFQLFNIVHFIVQFADVQPEPKPRSGWLSVMPTRTRDRAGPGWPSWWLSRRRPRARGRCGAIHGVTVGNRAGLCGAVQAAWHTHQQSPPDSPVHILFIWCHDLHKVLFLHIFGIYFCIFLHIKCAAYWLGSLQILV